MRLGRILATFAGGSVAYTSWLALRPLTQAEKDNWNAIYMEDQSLKLRAYRRIPLNALSRLWGRCHHAELPEFARSPVYGLYARLFDCNLDEAAAPDGAGLDRYRNLSEFFRRALKPGARPVCPDSGLVAPADGTVLQLGRVSPEGSLDQVKGVAYSLQGFLGPDPNSDAPSPSADARRIPDAEFHSELLLKRGQARSSTGSGQLYHCVIYLSPGDYHRFHSPADWLVAKRRHFSGYLMSVSPWMTARVAGLFCLNERAVYLGSWRHGFFAFAAIGATNVGSINVYSDQDLSTNRCGDPVSQFRDRQFLPAPLAQAKGQEFGEFDLGSTIVLLFEAPPDFAFTVAPGERVKVGQALGRGV